MPSGMYAPTMTVRWAMASWMGYEIICPRHGARFDVRTGKALTLPAVVTDALVPGAGGGWYGSKLVFRVSKN